MAMNAPDYLIATRNNLLDFIVANKDKLFLFNQFSVAQRQVDIGDLPVGLPSLRENLVDKWSRIKQAIDAGQAVDDRFIPELFGEFSRAVSAFAGAVVAAQNKALAGNRWRIVLLTDYPIDVYIDAMNKVEAAVQRDKTDKKIMDFSYGEIEPGFASFKAALQQNNKNTDKANEIRAAAQASGGGGSSTALQRASAGGMSGLTIGLIAAGSLVAAYVGYRWWKNRQR